MAQDSSFQENLSCCHNHIPSVGLWTLALLVAVGATRDSLRPATEDDSPFSAKLTLNNELLRKIRLVERIFILFQSKTV